MPSRAKTVCCHPGCNVLTVSRYCEAHDKQRIARGYGNGKTTARGYGYVWQKLRASVMRRDAYLCQACKAQGRLTVATEVDHITPKAHGGTDAMSNLRAICTPCHRTKTAREAGPGGGSKV